MALRFGASLTSVHSAILDVHIVMVFCSVVPYGLP